ncbi:hypothetical protein [Methylobacterium sp. CCH5-D2]|uniref:hypothetical protein n=1 Tax=Methylobacterium sp. CCH5-D2 TaxID=1768765 RepID=UPI00082EDDC2|nr:hypothetical protein [Methylobacterium sp. CCH5-D2]
MSSRRQAFRQADVARALKGALAAGMKPTQVEVSAEGRIVLSFEEKPAAEPAGAFDAWKAGRARAP